MPTNVSRVGAHTLPVPAGPVDGDFIDPCLAGFADYLQFSLRDALNVELARLHGTSADACPHTFLYDPAGYFVRNPFPALYVWSPRSVIQRRTIQYDMRVRTITAQYMFD